MGVAGCSWGLSGAWTTQDTSQCLCSLCSCWVQADFSLQDSPSKSFPQCDVPSCKHSAPRTDSTLLSWEVKDNIMWSQLMFPTSAFCYLLWLLLLQHFCLTHPVGHELHAQTQHPHLCLPPAPGRTPMKCSHHICFTRIYLAQGLPSLHP